MSLPAVSKHLKVLENAGLITRGREAQWRPARIKPEALKEVDGWLEKYRALWEARFDRLEGYLAKLQAKEKNRGRKTKPRR
jgi:DNA-binding transcriptional ArsR family regulator